MVQCVYTLIVPLVVVAMFVSADRFYRSLNFKYLLPVILGILYELLVSKGRLETAVVILVLFIGFQFGVKKNNLENFWIFYFYIVFCCFY